jgi:2'-5' RNA ligase
MGDSTDWKSAYQHGTFVIWPPGNLRQRLNELRKAHDPRSHGYCEAHISLTPPLKNKLYEHDRKSLGSIFESFSPCSLTLGSLANFPGSNCIYVEIAPQSPILELRKKLLATELFLPPSYPNFVAHCTVSEFGTSTQAETQTLLESLRSNDLCCAFLWSSVAMIVPNESFVFSETDTFNLGCSPDGIPTHSFG